MTPRRLQMIRKRLNMTQAEFAQFVGVAPNTVARWERAEMGMRPTTERLIEALVAKVDLTKGRE